MDKLFLTILNMSLTGAFVIAAICLTRLLLNKAPKIISYCQRVLKQIGGETKNDYLLSLLSLATERRIIGGSPLAFGEGGVKERIKNVLSFRRPSRGMIVAAVALAAVLSVGFAVNRTSDSYNVEKHTAWAEFNIDRNAEPQEAFTIPAEWFGNPSGKEMTLEDVRVLATKGDSLLFEDLRQYKGANASSNFDRYIMVYGVEGGYRLVVYSNPNGKPDNVSLESIWKSGGSGIDIRYNNVDAFLRNNPSQDAITEKQAQDIAQVRLEAELEPVSWHILGDWPERTDSDATFAHVLLDSIDTLNEPCWVFRLKGTAEWGGRYYAVGKKSGAIFICSFADNGKPVWDSVAEIIERKS